MQKDNVKPQGSGQDITADFVWEYFENVDTMIPVNVTQYYNDDSTFRFGNAPAAKGPQEILEALNNFYQLIKSMEHVNTGLWLGDKSGVFEAQVHFEKKSGKKVMIPAVSIMRLENDKVKDFRMVMDASPLMNNF